MWLRCLILVLLFSLGAEHSLHAQPLHLYSSAAVAGMHLPVWSAKDLGLSQKFGLSVDMVVISGGTIGVQSLLGGSTQTSSSNAMGAINTVMSGDDAVIIGGVLNKNLLKFVARKEILREVDLNGCRRWRLIWFRNTKSCSVCWQPTVTDSIK